MPAGGTAAAEVVEGRAERRAARPEAERELFFFDVVGVVGKSKGARVEVEGAAFFFFPPFSFCLSRALSRADHVAVLPRARTLSNALILTAPPANERAATGTRRRGRARRANRRQTRHIRSGFLEKLLTRSRQKKQLLAAPEERRQTKEGRIERERKSN